MSKKVLAVFKLEIHTSENYVRRIVRILSISSDLKHFFSPAAKSQYRLPVSKILIHLIRPTNIF